MAPFLSSILTPAIFSLAIKPQQPSSETTSSGITRSSSAKTTTITNLIQEEVKKSRQIQQYGFIGGGTMLGTAVTAGVTNGFFPNPLSDTGDPISPSIILPSVAFGLVAFIINTLSYNEYHQPLNEQTYFDVKDSTISNAGKGLFAKQDISDNTYLFEYIGERLSETEYFIRYPTGQGRYVAVIQPPLFSIGDEPVYIDGIDITKSNIARYMNSAPASSSSPCSPIANVRWKKQRFGNKPSMYFYTCRDIEKGDELFFDYGSQYWDAVTDDENE